MSTFWTVALGASALALMMGACGGPSSGVTCVEDMPGMIMCPQDGDQVVPAIRVAPTAKVAPRAQ